MNAVFFDMDGTLIDSRADLAAAVNATRKELGFAVYPYSERDTYADNIYTSGYNESWWEFHPTLHM